MKEENGCTCSTHGGYEKLIKMLTGKLEKRPELRWHDDTKKDLKGIG
jgi:hypothetical protein